MYCVPTLSKLSSSGNTRRQTPPTGVMKISGSGIIFLISGFHECILLGSLKHYFIPGFNLLSVKLTTGARVEILRILHIALQSDISIMKECNTLKPVWDKFVNHNLSWIRDSALRWEGNILKTDVCLMRHIVLLQRALLKLSQSEFCISCYSIWFPMFPECSNNMLVVVCGTNNTVFIE